MRAVIVNPASASGRTADRWRRIVSALEGDGVRREVELTSGPGDAIRRTRALLADGIRELTILGGDGTIGEVVAGCIRPDGSGMLADDIVLSIVHQGTGGDIARGLGIPKDEAGAVRTEREGTPTRIDVGVATYIPHDGAEPHVRGFASTANVGLAADVVARVGGPLKRFGNNASFALATVSCLARNRPRPVRVTTAEGIDEQLRIVDIDVCNNRFMGGGMLVAPDASFTDGAFDVIMITAASRARLIKTFPKIYSGRHVHDPLVRVERTQRITVQAADGAGGEQGVVLDGEHVGSTPATFTVLPAALSVRIAP